MALSAPFRPAPIATAGPDDSPGRGPLPLVAGAVALGTLAGVATVLMGPLVPLILLASTVGVALILVEPRWGLAAALAIIAILPFGTLPFKVAVTPTLLESTLLLTWAVLALRVLLRRDERLVPTALDGPLVLFLIVTLFAFLLGLGRGYTSQTLHDYAKMVLSISIFLLVTNLLRERRDLALAMTGIGIGAAAAAGLGLALRALGRGAEPILLRLARIGYPTGKILRYIEDDPAKPLRATGTSVDPNSFAGFLMVALVILIAQAVARRPLVPRLLAAMAVPPVGLCLLLTYSRAAWVGAAAGVLLIALLRYRWLLPPLAAGGAAVLALGVGGAFVERLILGIRLQDPATKLRLAEYRNAIAIIREHPLFGVGFGAAPSIDLQAGVSSLYLTIAERLGLFGLGVFGLVLLVLAAQLWPPLRRLILDRQAPPHAAEAEAVVALTGALGAALVAGALDHYFFHLGFAHMAAVFWGLVGLAVVAARGVAGLKV
ncbi:MAG: membrane protein, putative [uncultured Thermomicrobiales bacterium]|uniref:Membrane protein, putative n=1 Tax=uncultured Thermomicrobiales bacterium TaxID=1645740 RepID=A0A6J4U740_9BACT|nr:MAG: membrane protein, putative [uncultured Thermomicrobiales bacterium]